MLLLSDLLDIAISVGSSVSVEAHWDQETGIIQSDQGHYPVTSDEHHVMITGHHEHHVMITGHHEHHVMIIMMRTIRLVAGVSVA